MKIIVVSAVVLTTVSRQDPVLSFATHPMISNSIGSDPRCARNVKAARGSDLNRTRVIIGQRGYPQNAGVLVVLVYDLEKVGDIDGQQHWTKAGSLWYPSGQLFLF